MAMKKDCVNVLLSQVSQMSVFLSQGPSCIKRMSPLPVYNSDKLGLQFSIMEIQSIVVYCVAVGH